MDTPVIDTPVTIKVARISIQSLMGEMNVIAVCFECGGAKLAPMAKCEFCKKKPSSREDRIASLALSSECLQEHNLKKGSDFIKKHKRRPKFHESLQSKATQLVEAYIEVSPSNNSDSIDLSSSFFDFSFSQNANVETVKVHAIGKPEHLKDDYHGHRNNAKTYHTLQWEIGKDISAEDANAFKDPAGDIFIWYRWMSQNWTWKCVSRIEFEQLKSVEN